MTYKVRWPQKNCSLLQIEQNGAIFRPLQHINKNYENRSIPVFEIEGDTSRDIFQDITEVNVIMINSHNKDIHI